MFIMQSFNPGDWGKKSISAPYMNSRSVVGSGHRFRFCCDTSVREVGRCSLVSYSKSVFLSVCFLSHRVCREHRGWEEPGVSGE